MKIASFIAALFAVLGAWSPAFSQAQDDLSAKAQAERELVVYGTALAGHFEKFVEPFRHKFPFIKTQYSRTTGEALTSKIRCL